MQMQMQMRMQMRCSGANVLIMTTAIIIGVGPGLGSAIARRFAREGYDLVLLNRSTEAMTEVATAAEAMGRRVSAHQVDVGDPSALARAVGEGCARLGPIGALVYNAIRFSPETPTAISPVELRRDMDVALGGLAVAVQTALPALRASAADSGSSSILITGGGAALYPASTMGTLPITKSAQRAYALTLADELAGTPVRVATITIMGEIGGSERFSPDAIADAFWSAHAGAKLPDAEILYGPE